MGREGQGNFLSGNQRKLLLNFRGVAVGCHLIGFHGFGALAEVIGLP